MSIEEHISQSQLLATEEINSKKNNTQFENDDFHFYEDEPEIPFAQIPNEILRHKTLSIECMWLISYLLSHKENWVIKTKQIMKHLKGRMGRNVVYRVINEAIEAGYMKREEKVIKNHKTYIYFISRTPRFKKSFLRTVFEDTEKGDTKERTSFKNTKEEESIQKISDVEKPKPKPTEDSFKKDSIPSFEEKKKKKEFAIEIDSPELLEIYSLEEYYIHFFTGWQITRWLKKFGSYAVLQTLKYFLKQTLSKIRNAGAWMEAAFKDKYAKIDGMITENKKYAKEFVEKHKLKFIEIKNRYLVNTENEKEIYFTFPPETFKERLREIFLQ